MNYYDKIKTLNGYKFSQYSNQTILSTSFVVLTKHLLQEEVENKEEVIRYLLSTQNDEGFFVDLNYKYHEHPEHNPSYVLPQFTFFSLLALDILGEKKVKLSFMESLDINELDLILNKSLEKNFWATSNQLMFLMYFITYSLKYLDIDKDKYHSYIEHIFRFLNKNQNIENGFWGCDKTTESIYAKAYGGAHIYLFYDYFNKEIPNVHKIIDNCLLMHSSNGLIQTVEGGACEDYDIIEIYYRCLKQTDHRKSEIIVNLMKMKRTLLKDMKADKSFSYKVCSKNNFYKFFNSNLKKQTYKYSSWDYMETPIYYSDTWGTFFRYLGLKMIDNIIDGDNNFNSASLPGWGYI